MKNKLSFLCALVALMMMSGQAWAGVTMTFNFVNSQNEVVKDVVSSYNIPVRVYLQGEEVATTKAINDDNWNFTGSWSMTFDDALAGKTVSYENYFGERGTFVVTEGATLSSKLVTLTVTVKDTEGQPVSDTYVVIYTPNGNSSGYYTNSDGQIVNYYAASTGYRWKWNDQSGTFDLTADYALNITKQASTQVTLTVGSRYGDFPYKGGNLYLYKYGDEENSLESFYNGSGSKKVDAGDYWLKDDLGKFTEKITVTADMTYWMEYHKVTFKWMTGNTPVADQRVRAYYDKDAWDNKSVTTNANGEGAVYLAAGTYSYRILDSETYTEFTVGNADQTVAINTSSVTITLDCDATAEDLKNQSFSWGTDNRSTNVQPEAGKIFLSPIMPGSYQLTINDLNTIDVDVALGENNKTVKLYALQFTTNIETTNKMYVNDGAKRMDFGKKYYLTAGEYSYSQNYYGTPMGTIDLTQNTEVPLNYGILTVTVKDSKGVVAGQQVTFGGYSRETDENGQVTFTELVGDGKYTLEARDCYVSQDYTLKAGEQTATLTIPDFVTFTMLHMGQPMNTDNVWLYAVENTNVSYRAQVVNGVAKARLDPTLTYIINGYHGATAITEGSTVSLGQLNVTCDGMGIALPMENWDAISSYFVLVGTTVRLAAIPVGGSSFQKWDVNGAEYAEGMMDLKITEPVTTAKAVFGETVPTKVKKFVTNTTFNSDGRFVYLPENVSGTVSIYAFDGKLMKNLGVSGDQIGIYDLPTGAYIITLKSDDGDTKVARFMK